METILIPFPQHYLWQEMQQYMGHGSGKLLHPQVGEWFYRCLHLTNNQVLFRSRVEPEMNQVRVEVLKYDEREEAISEVCDFVEEWWDLSRDLGPFYEQVKNDDLMGPLVAKRKGLRIGGIPDLWECTAWSIVGQQVNVSFATTLKNRLIKQWGRKTTWQEVEIWQFPSTQVVSQLDPGHLKPLSISQRKAEYLIGFAQLIEKGAISKSKLKGYETAEEASRELKKIRGIGTWSANYILLRCLRYPDAFPLGDAALYNAIRDMLGMERKPTDGELLELASNWKGWEAYATYHLWYGR